MNRGEGILENTDDQSLIVWTFATVDPLTASAHGIGMITADLDRRLNRYGLSIRGAFHPGPDDLLISGMDIRTLVLIGNKGPAMWRVFSEAMADVPHPLDTWTKDVLSPIAAEFGARVVFPFEGPPYHPFQRWALAADDVSPSPIGPLIHPVYGMWHAYRAAFLFADRLDIPPHGPRSPSPCETCADKPCLTTCPVGAFTPGGYDVPACRGHIGLDGENDCLAGGCLARRACPVGRDYIYDAPQAAFHMHHFLYAD